MKPGRDMDAAVAEIIGELNPRCEYYKNHWRGHLVNTPSEFAWFCDECKLATRLRRPKCFSFDDAVAFTELWPWVEKKATTGDTPDWGPCLRRASSGKRAVGYAKGVDFAYGDTWAEVLCLAVLALFDKETK